MLPFRLTLAVLIGLLAGNALAQTSSVDSLPPGSSQSVLSGKATAARNLAFYSAEIVVSTENADERAGALARAFNQVVLRVTGNPRAADNAALRRAALSAESLASQVSYRQDSELVSGAPTYKTVLVATFNPDAVDALISGAGLKIWGADRPKPIVWLAIDDGRGPRLVTGQQLNVVKPLASRGLERGMRFLLPAGTATEVAAMPAILALNAAAMQPQTARYGNDLQLLGKVYRKPPGWAADWLLSQAGTELARWSFSDGDPRRVIASGVDTGADAIAARDGVVRDIGSAGSYRIDVEGVDDQAEYFKVMAYLQGLPIVRKVAVIEVRPSRLRLQVDLAIGLGGLGAMVDMGNMMQFVSDGDNDAGTDNAVGRFLLK